MPNIIDTLNMGLDGLQFTDAATLGVTESSPTWMYPIGLTAMEVNVADGWPTSGNVLTSNIEAGYLYQILIGSNGSEMYTRSQVASGVTFLSWEPWLPEPWTDVTSFTNGWVNYGSVYSPAGYRKDRGGVVRLRGLIRNGTVNSSAFSLPTGYFPSTRLIFPCITYSNTFGSVRIYESGLVVPYTPSSTSWVSLDGISFQVE